MPANIAFIAFCVLAYVVIAAALVFTLPWPSRRDSGKSTDEHFCFECGAVRNFVEGHCTVCQTLRAERSLDD